MTEAEWLASADPATMLKLPRVASDRKLRLFAAACCGRNWHLLSEDVSRPGLEVVERYADQLATASELAEARRAARGQGKEFEKLFQWRTNTRGRSPEADLHYRESQQADLIAYASQPDDYLWGVLLYTTQCKLRSETDYRPVIDQTTNEDWQRLCDADRAELAELLRDIAGNPFRPVAVDPGWRTETVVALAAGIYAERAWDRMPVLADALEDAGCGDPDVLGHCRGPGSHARGCWVVDRLLSKS